MFQIIDTLMMIGFVLFLVYIFRGYHLSRIDRYQDKENDPSDENRSDVS